MKINVIVTRVPLFGKPKEREIEVELESDGVSLATVLEKAGVPIKGMQVSVNGQPMSDQNMHVKDGARVQLAKGRQSSPRRVQLTERASGS
jgi:sulfur carrier protein ThiS